MSNILKKELDCTCADVFRVGTCWNERLQMKKSTTKKAEGYIVQTLPKKPKSPLQRYRLLRKGKDVLA